MSRFQVFIKQFNEDGEYVDNFTEITQDVSNLGDIALQLDNTTFENGVIRNSNLSLRMRNDEGLYSEADTLKSIFKVKRTDSIIKVTWDYRDNDLVTGFFHAGEEPLTEPVEIFRGLLADVSSSSDIKAQDIQFQVLGYETLLEREVVPYDDISNGDSVESILYAMLNQTKITQLLTVDAGNISVSVNTLIDDKTTLENKTVKEALDLLFDISNAVLRVENQTIYITPRDPSASDMYAFYGQASNSGIENIITIKNFRDGLNRLFNYWTWDDSTLFSKDDTSLGTYGVFKNTIKSDLVDVASTSKIQAILDDNKTEFAFPKTEFMLDAPISYDTLALNLLDKVSVDYPTVYSPADNRPLPRYGQDIYDDPVYPFEQWSLNISSSDRFKIIGKRISTKKEVITFTLRKV